MQRLALLLGIRGGLARIGPACFPPFCVPVTEASEVYCDRLRTPPLTCR